MLFNPISKLAKFEHADVMEAKTDEDVKYRLFNENMSLVGAILKKWNIVGDEQDDFIQEMWIVYDKAINDFDPSYGTSFSSYLYTAMDRAMSRLILEHKKDENTVELYDVADEKKDNNISEESKFKLQDIIEKVKIWIDETFGNFSTKYKKVFDLMMKGLTLEAIGDSVGITKERVRQITDSIKAKMNEEAGDFKFGMETWIDDNGQYKISSIIVDTWDNLNKVAEQDHVMLYANEIKIGSKILKLVSSREAILDKVLIDKIAVIEQNVKYGEAKISRMEKVSFVKNCPGHKNSKGEDAPWCIVSHETGKILSSHTSKEKADEHLKQMEVHKHMGEIEVEGYINKEGYLVKADGTEFTVEELNKFAAEDSKSSEQNPEGLSKTEKAKKDELEGEEKPGITEDEWDGKKSMHDEKTGKDIAVLKLNQKAFNLEDGNILAKFLHDENMLENRIRIDISDRNMSEYFTLEDYDDMLSSAEKDKIKLKLNEIFKNKDPKSGEIN